MGPPQESVAEELINRKLKKSSMVDSFKLQSDKSGKVVAIPIFQESDDPGFQMRGGQVTTSVIGKKKDGGGSAGAADASASDPGLIIFSCCLCLSDRSSTICLEGNQSILDLGGCFSITNSWLANGETISSFSIFFKKILEFFGTNLFSKDSFTNLSKTKRTTCVILQNLQDS